MVICPNSCCINGMIIFKYGVQNRGITHFTNVDTSSSRSYESLEGSFSYEFAYEFGYPLPPIGYEIIYFNRKLDVLLDMEMTPPGFRKKHCCEKMSSAPLPKLIFPMPLPLQHHVPPLLQYFQSNCSSSLKDWTYSSHKLPLPLDLWIGMYSQ